MSNRILNEDQHFLLLEKGASYLEENVADLDKKLWDFTSSMCLKMVQALGKEKIAHEFNLDEYQDPDFVQHLSLRIEFGVAVFLIQTNLYNHLFNTPKLLPVVTALNFYLAQFMAECFNNLQLRLDTTSCVYANDALLIIANRTMKRIEDQSKEELAEFAKIL